MNGRSSKDKSNFAIFPIRRSVLLMLNLLILFFAVLNLSRLEKMFSELFKNVLVFIFETFFS